MKVAIIGGSAQSTPHLFEYLSKTCLTDMRITLLGRDRSRLGSVRRAANLLLGRSPINVGLALIQPGQFETAIEGSDVVVLQVRIGGYRARAFDETFPLKYGVCGDEGLGPGGLSAAWRAWPEIHDLVAKVQEFAPSAKLVILSSPVGILVRAVRDLFPQAQAVGICELPLSTLSQICRDVSADLSATHFEYLGINHIGWFHHISAGDRNIVHDYIQLPRHRAFFPSSELVQSCLGVPTKYLRLHYNATEVLKDQMRSPHTRAAYLEDLSSTAFPTFSDGTSGQIRCVLNKRPAPWYSLALGPLLIELAGQPMLTPYFLSVPNNSFHPGFQDDDILEIPHFLVNGELQPSKQSHPQPTSIAELIKSFVKYERIATSAIANRDESYLEEALRSHPWTCEISDLRSIVRDIVHGI